MAPVLVFNLSIHSLLQVRKVSKYLTLCLLTITSFSAYSATLTGNYKYNSWTSPGPSNAFHDASGATFVEANSKNSNPTPSKRCTSGSLPINYYPVKIRNYPGQTLSKALILGEVPQNSIWGPTYCNSAAIIVDNGANNAVIDGVRLNNTWDAIRTAFRGANNFTIRNVWHTNGRDDCIENDAYNSGTIEDSLFENCFIAMSMREGSSGGANSSAKTVYFKNSLFHMNEHKHSKKDGSQQSTVVGTAIKGHNNSPAVDLDNVVFAWDGRAIWHDDSNITMYFGKNASKLRSCNNVKFLWMWNDNPPAVFNNLNSCIEVQSGQQAIDTWQAERCAWINNHPSNVTRRMPGDPESCTSRRPLPPEQLDIQPS